MFKIRKPIGSSVSPELDLLSDTDSGGDSGRQVEQGDSVSESRFSVSKDDQFEPRSSSVSIIEHGINAASPHRRGSGGGLLQGLSELSGTLLGKTMLDRKRKERHESTSQGQEKKVIRSVSDDESMNSDKNGDFRRTVSHDSFNSKKEQQVYTIEMRKPASHDIVDFVKKSTTDLSVDGKVARSENVPSGNLILGGEPQFDVKRKVTISENYEPELQRQLERSTNWTNAPTTEKKKAHKRRHKKQGKPALSIEIDNGDCVEEEEELHSPASETSTDSVDMIEPQGVPSVEVDEVEDVTSQTSQRLMALDFSGQCPQTSIEHANVVSLRAALGGTSADDEVMLSPRNSVLGKEGIDIPPSPPLYQAPMDPPISRQGYLDGNPVTKMNELSRQITALKRQLKSLESEYEHMYGYRPSHSDKLNNKEMRKCVLQLSKAKKELKQIREDPSCFHDLTGLSMGTGNILCVSRGNSVPPQKGTPEYAKYLEGTVREIERTLADKRRAHNRPDELEKMSSLELQDEKCLMQRQLLVLEKRHGRPSSKLEKDIVRPLYERYRAIKRSSVKIACVRESSIDLVPIVEGETLEFCDVNESPLRVGGMNNSRQQASNNAEDEERDNERNESYNEMSLCELEARLKQVKEEKRRMRALIRKFETDFQNITGRPPQKDEKYSSPDMEQAYQRYKRIKATVRLLDVLINKRKCPALITDLNKMED